MKFTLFRKKAKRTVRDGSRRDELRAFKALAVQSLILFSEWFQIKAQPVLRKVDWALIRTSVLILALSFVVANSVNTFAANLALNSMGAGQTGAGNSRGSALVTGSAPMVPSGEGGLTPPELRKGIIDRNLFNSAGKLPPEADPAANTARRDPGLDFAGVPCTEEKLPVEVVGTIYTGNPETGFVTVKDPKLPDTDTYKVGALVIDHEEFEIYKVNRGSVEFRKGDEKICVRLKGFEKSPRTDVAQNGPSAVAPGSVRPENVESVEFDSQYIAQAIGEGYRNILNDAKLIPEVDGSGKVLGFKIIAIAAGSLFEKMKLQNGDVIVDVNGVSMRDASQGFKLYQALQEEREITVNILRNNEPMTRKVRAK